MPNHHLIGTLLDFSPLSKRFVFPQEISGIIADLWEQYFGARYSASWYPSIYTMKTIALEKAAFANSTIMRPDSKVTTAERQKVSDIISSNSFFRLLLYEVAWSCTLWGLVFKFDEIGEYNNA